MRRNGYQEARVMALGLLTAITLAACDAGSPSAEPLVVLDAETDPPEIDLAAVDATADQSIADSGLDLGVADAALDDSHRDPDAQPIDAGPPARPARPHP